ncbi:YlxR family protein [Arcanobacterium ihumii]|uniref:YlxR family protein n=1 Tax=Arcanobacterium ihumii TaxID=2138162 RepID=UPI000F539740|nr:YlxR family protein [Arcanobacterium ihumii]
MSKNLSSMPVLGTQASAVAQEPSRTCIGCKNKDVRSQMLRLKAVETDLRMRIRIEPHSATLGRGAWIHKNPRCFAQARKRRAFSVAFRTSLPFDISELTDAFDSQISTNNESG